jgi:tRNAThr (cytosine32-N3)-methyltransferase
MVEETDVEGKVTEQAAGKKQRSRFLESETDVYTHNAWDNVDWDAEALENAENILQVQRSAMANDQMVESMIAEADLNWDNFYRIHGTKFFKDRKWFEIEYPELFTRPDYLSSADEQFRIFEVGCGVGNSLFPLLDKYEHSALPFHLYACDFAPAAVDLIRASEKFQRNQGNCTVFVHDISCQDESLFDHVHAESVDVVLMIYVLSAISPEMMEGVMKKIHKALKPGGLVLFRDYGRYDLAQLRFKPGRMLKDNFYFRGDNTLVYFFTENELRNLAESNGFDVLSIEHDRRLLVNRKEMKKMYRSWMQCKFRKPLSH